MKSVAYLQVPHDAVFHGKLKRVPEALRDALVACGMADPGLLAAYPRADLGTLGLQGSHRRRLLSKSAAVAGETPYSGAYAVVHYLLILFTFITAVFLFFLPLSFMHALPFSAYFLPLRSGILVEKRHMTLPHSLRSPLVEKRHMTLPHSFGLVWLRNVS